MDQEDFKGAGARRASLQRPQCARVPVSLPTLSEVPAAPPETGRGMRRKN